jgi:hypothetical protein
MFYNYHIELFFQETVMTGGKIHLTHTRKIAVLLVFFCFSLVSPVIFAQTQPKVRIYIAPMESGSQEEQGYFMTNMKMEFTGASYEVVDVPEDSDYNVTLSVSRQEPPEDTQAEGANPASPGNTITLTLFDTKTKRELIALSWDYRQLSEMDMWNLYLITQAMSNAPIVKMPAGTQLAEVSVKPVSDIQNKLLWIGVETPLGYAYPGDGPYISTALAVEYNFLPFLGVGTSFGYRALFPIVIDPNNKTYFHTTQQSFFVPILFRFLFSIDNYLVIPYIGMEFNFGTLGLLPKHAFQEADQAWYIPAITGGAGFRFSAGPGALELGSRIIYDFAISGWGIEFTVGYKFGFLTRTKKDPATETY